MAGHAERATMLDVVGAVVAAVRHGLLTIAEARRRYDLSVDEFLAWHVAFDEDWPLVGDRDRLQ